MLRLTREIRFTVPLAPCEIHPPANGLSGNLPDTAGLYLVLQLTLAGDLNPTTSYIQNIKLIDDHVWRTAIPAICHLVWQGSYTLARALQVAQEHLANTWASARLDALRLYANPWLSYELSEGNPTMLCLTQRFEFSAAHRLHNPALDDQANRDLFGKCNNPAGHGHNYEFEVTLAGPPNPAGQLINPDDFATLVHRVILTRFDHKHLNIQTDEFRDVIPSVENIAKTIFDLLDPHFRNSPTLHCVRVWETGKTWAEYSRT